MHWAMSAMRKEIPEKLSTVSKLPWKSIRKSGPDLPSVEKNTDNMGIKTVDKSVIFSAVNADYALGYLATTYAPWIPEFSNTHVAREYYSKLLAAAADFLGGKLEPHPITLTEKGRGKNQFHTIELRFGQITDICRSHPAWIRLVPAILMAAGRLILLVFEGEQLVIRPDISDHLQAEFVGDFIRQLEDFAELAERVSLICKTQRPNAHECIFTKPLLKRLTRRTQR